MWLLVLLHLFDPLAGQENEWKLLRSKEFGFSVMFPEQPVQSTDSVETELGAMAMNLFIHDASQQPENEDQNVIYLVNYSRFAAEKLAQKASNEENFLDDFYANSISGLLTNVGGKLISEENKEIVGHSGREITVDFRDGLAVISIWMVLIENNYYMLQTITLTENYPNESITQFFGSFQLSSSE